MQKSTIAFIISFLLTLNTFAQKKLDEGVTLYSTAVKINLNGLQVGVEQRIGKHICAQIEGLYTGPKLTKISPQFRYYPYLSSKRLLSYFAIGYFYKHQENNYTDSVKVTGTSVYQDRDFSVSKYIHTVTLNYGYIYKTLIFKQQSNFEFNAGAGIRFKKSNRYGIAQNEEIDLREAYILRPQAYQDTKGKFLLYPELTIMLSLVLPLCK